MIGLLLWSALASATTFQGSASLSELAQRSQAVVRGVVVETSTQQRGRNLETRYTIAVEDALAGDVAEEVSVTLPGGHLNGLTQRVNGVPLWTPGDDVIVFVPRPGEPISLRGIFSVQAEQIIDPLVHRAAYVPLTVPDLGALLDR